MQTQIQLILTPEQAEKQDLLMAEVAKNIEVSVERITKIRTLKKSIDARSMFPKIKYQLL